MKRKMLASIGIALVFVAALAMTAFASPAEASVSIDGPQTVVPGETIQITITGTGEGINGSIQTSGLEYVEEDSQLSSQNVFVLLPDFGTSNVVYTYRVTAESGTVSVTLSDIYQAQDGDAVSLAAPAPWTAEVEAAEPTPTPTPSETAAPTEEPTQTSEPTATPTATTTATTTATAAPTTSTRPSATPAPSTDRVPKTGDATMDLWVLAVIAIGCTGIAAVAAKKVWSNR